MKLFEMPEIEITEFAVEDVITTSGEIVDPSIPDMGDLVP